MKNFCILCLAAASLLSQMLHSQNTGHIEIPLNNNADSWENVLEELLDGSFLDDEKLEQFAVQLEELHDNPININRATPQQLGQLQFLSDSQIEEISAYIYFHGPMLSLGELQLVEGLDYDTRRLLRHFVTAGPGPEKHGTVKMSQVMDYARHELVSGIDIPMYRRNGFRSHSSEELARYPNRQYHGGQLAGSLRWNMNWNDRIRLGVTAQHDAGEKFRMPTGFDFISPYLFLKDTGPFRTLALGRFKAQYGYGLLLGNAFTMGVGTISPKGISQGIKPYSSASENGYFTGAGVQIGIDRLELSGFISHQKTDASIADNGSIRSLKTDGYHRTQLEIERRRNVTQSDAGFSAQYSSQGIEIGATALAELFSRPFPTSRFRAGISTDYAVKRTEFAFWGETAQAFVTGKAMGFATLDNVLLHLERFGELGFSARYYSPGYESLHSGAMSQSKVQNEYGLGASWTGKSGKRQASVSADFYGHPQPCYGASAPSHGMQIRASWQTSDKELGKFLANLNFRSVQKDCKASGRLEYRTTIRFKFRYTGNLAPGWSWQGQTLQSLSVFKGTEPSWGRSAGLSINRSGNQNKGRKCCLDADVAAFLFRTDSFDSALSYYEKGARYQFGFMNLSGYGTRLSSMVRLRFRDGLQASLKASGTLYFDRDCIGDGAQRIDSSHKQDIGLQIVWKFHNADFHSKKKD